jgi:hypothetical protein
MQHFQGKAVYVDWAAEMPEQREGLVLSKTSIFSGLAAIEESRTDHYNVAVSLSLNLTQRSFLDSLRESNPRAIQSSTSS